MPSDMSGHTVIITGAAGGLGLAIVEKFAETGAHVIAHHRPGRPGALPEVAVVHSRVHLQPAELLDDDDLAALFTHHTLQRGLRVLVNCAGAYPISPITDMPPTEFDAVLRTNLTTTYSCLRRAAPHMSAGASIINIASLNAARPMPGQAAYASAKAAVVALTQVAALELAPHGIRVNAVSPGLIDRPGLATVWPEGVARWRRASPQGQLGQPTDIADACLYLASPQARWITGQNLTVDGGTSVAPPY